MNQKDLEKYSSAYTLSDMEIFIFPELLYALVLANILSPEIWKWRDHKWFQKIESMPPLKRIQRLKQYIMDHYDFNLDLETWGLTDKETEINRFREFVDIEVLRKSNALFGYEGDKYYFDIDIRRHFGLDKFDTDIIPYWKTETIEAMNAFRYKPNHPTGAGECVSLATLYAAALFIVARIPLEQIFLMGTPLHSQNFILTEDGVLTNNRRILTKSMWYNGSELSALARRALEHEQVAIVTHHTGYIHSTFPEATIDPLEYRQFRDSLTSFLNTPVDYEIFINFLRYYSRYQKRFQLKVPCRGTVKYLALEKAFGYEHGSKNRLGDKTAKKLLCEIGDEDFSPCPFDGRATISSNDQLFQTGDYQEFIASLLDAFPELDPDKSFSNDLKRFVHTVPKLPVDRRTGGQADRRTGGQGYGITTDITREEILERLLRIGEKGSRVQDQGSKKFPLHQSPVLSSQFPVPSPQSPVPSPQSPVASHQSPVPSRQSPVTSHQSPVTSPLSYELALYAGRFMDYCDWEPFLKAVMERNPVSVAFFREKDIEEVYSRLISWPDASIYEGNRLSLPDEVVNFGRGDGIEKALTLANVIRSRDRNTGMNLKIEGKEVVLSASGEQFAFISGKAFRKMVAL